MYIKRNSSSSGYCQVQKSESGHGEGDTRCQQPAWNVHCARESGVWGQLWYAAKPFRCIYENVWFDFPWRFSDVSSGTFVQRYIGENSIWFLWKQWTWKPNKLNFLNLAWFTIQILWKILDLLDKFNDARFRVFKYYSFYYDSSPIFNCKLDRRCNIKMVFK